MDRKSFLGYIVLGAIIGLFGNYVYRNYHTFTALRLAHPWLIAVLIMLFIMEYFFIGLVTRTLLRPLKVNLTYFESFGLSITTGFYNIIAPKGGMATRALYLNKKHNFPITDFFASLAASYLLIFVGASIIGLISVMLLGRGYILLPVFLAALIPSICVIIFSPRLPETRYSLINKGIRVLNGWHLIRHEKGVIVKVTLLSMLQILTLAFMAWLQFKVFDIILPYISALILTTIGTISIIITITPAGLGISEAVTVFTALTLGISVDHSLTVALLARAVQMAVMLVLGPIFSYLLLRKSYK